MAVLDECVDGEDRSAGVSLEHKDNDANCEIPQPNEGHFGKHKEDVEPDDVVPAHAVVDPEAVVVVLPHADAASRAVVFSRLHRMQADHAEPIDFLSLAEESVIVVLDMLLWRDYESSEQYDRASEGNRLRDVDPGDLYVDDCEAQHQHDDRKAVVENRLQV